jgi:transcriptional regulator with AAA-type ATPase domain
LHTVVLVTDLLIADRFVALSPTRWFDLGTGARALVRVERAGTLETQAAWADRCGALCGLWHPALLPCTDFGVLGTTHRFEAYRAAARSPVSAGGRLPSARDVEDFLAACGVAVPTVMGTIGNGAAVPAPFPLDAPGSGHRVRDRRRRLTIGLRLARRRVMEIILERLEAEPSPGWSLLEIAAPRGAGGRTLLDWCAREGRRRGWVPLASEAWADSALPRGTPAWTRLLEGRHVLVLHDGRRRTADDRRVSQMLLQLARVHGSRHLLLRLTGEPPGRQAVALEPMSDRELTTALVVLGAGRGMAMRVRRALGAAGGLPGPFIAHLLRPPPQGRARMACAVHERAEAYDASQSIEVDARAPVRPLCGPFEVTDPQVVRLCSRGRHVSAARLVRRHYTAAHRRGHACEAARAARVQAALSRSRGRSGEACEWLLRAASHAAAAGDAATGAAIAVERAHALVDVLDLDAADAAARAADAAGELDRDRVIQAAAWLARARIAWWRGRVEEVAMLARRVAEAPLGSMPPRLAAAAHVWCARAALASGDMPAARGWIRSARDLNGGECRAPAVLLAEATWLAATGDLETLARVLAAARGGRARGPLGAVLDALAIEGPLLHGRPPGPRVLARVGRRIGVPLAPVLNTRLQLAHLEAADPARAAAQRRKLADAGLAAFAHVLPGIDRSVVKERARLPMLDDVVAVLRLCQDHDDPARALDELARFVLARGRCTGVAVVASGRAPVVVAAVPSAPGVPGIARRVIDGGIAIGPASLDGSVEVAVPVRCAARTIGAIACRWLDALPMDGDRAVAWLGAVAVACAPCIQAVADRLDPPALPFVGQELIGESAAIEEVRRAVARAADAPYPVLVEGESGVGKELVARAIHRASGRRTRSFAALNCAALPDELVEAELFGHARGAFTGALIERRGLFEEAHGGVLFLDEVGELSVRAQAKLLWALQEGEIRRIGETHDRRVDVRVVAATNRALAVEVEKGQFRRDLWYRLDVIHLRVPPLRERPDDVPVLARAFWQKASERVGSRAVLGPAVLAALARYDWPGNVRELQNVIAALAVAAPRRGVVPGSCLPDSVARLAEQRAAVTLDAARRGFEVRYVRAALARAGGHRGRAASELGLTRQGLVKLLDRLGLREDDEGAAVGPG